jgi:hypothetical protein
MIAAGAPVLSRKDLQGRWLRLRIVAGVLNCFSDLFCSRAKRMRLEADAIAHHQKQRDLQVDNELVPFGFCRPDYVFVALPIAGE